MRCAVDYDDEKMFMEQNINAWGEMQSLKEEPCYREEDIKDKLDKEFFRGYKLAMDNVYTALNNMGYYCDDAENKNMCFNDFEEDLKRSLDGDLCMVLFSILDNQED